MFKHILTPASGAVGDGAAFEVALAVSRSFSAHLEFLHARPDPRALAVSMAETQLGGGYAVDSFMQQIETEGRAGEARARAAWKAFCTANALAAEDAGGMAGGTAELVVRIGDETRWLVEHGRTADLIVTGRRRDGEAVALTLLQDVLCGAGRPVLIVPPDPVAPLFDRVVIAWKNTAEAARAVTAAMPFIARATDVLVLTVDEDGALLEGGYDGSRSGERLLATLRRHNPFAHARHLAHSTAKPVEALLGVAGDAKASLLVMGGYGHGRMREMVFGGFTQHVLRDAPMPVLMMH